MVKRFGIYEESEVGLVRTIVLIITIINNICSLLYLCSQLNVEPHHNYAS